jgi:hypothetical protein
MARTVHIIPSAAQAAIGAELYLPIDGFDLQGEIVYSRGQTREARDGYQLSPFTERTGTLEGYGFYVQAGYWIVGDRDIVGLPAYGRPLHADLTAPQKPARHGLQAVARFERMLLTYSAAARGGVADASTPNGEIEVDAVTLGANYWATRHLRVGLDYGLYSFAGRATAPARALAPGVDDDARQNGRTLHEIQARVGVQF